MGTFYSHRKYFGLNISIRDTWYHENDAIFLRPKESVFVVVPDVYVRVYIGYMNNETIDYVLDTSHWTQSKNVNQNHHFDKYNHDRCSFHLEVGIHLIEFDLLDELISPFIQRWSNACGRILRRISWTNPMKIGAKETRATYHIQFIHIPKFYSTRTKNSSHANLDFQRPTYACVCSPCVFIADFCQPSIDHLKSIGLDFIVIDLASSTWHTIIRNILFLPKWDHRIWNVRYQ